MIRIFRQMQKENNKKKNIFPFSSTFFCVLCSTSARKNSNCFSFICERRTNLLTLCCVRVYHITILTQLQYAHIVHIAIAAATYANSKRRTPIWINKFLSLFLPHWLWREHSGRIGYSTLCSFPFFHSLKWNSEFFLSLSCPFSLFILSSVWSDFSLSAAQRVRLKYSIDALSQCIVVHRRNSNTFCNHSIRIPNEEGQSASSNRLKSDFSFRLFFCGELKKIQFSNIVSTVYSVFVFVFFCLYFDWFTLFSHSFIAQVQRTRENSTQS